jgi:transketolase
LGLIKGRPNLEVFAETLLELARMDPLILAVTSDSRGSGKLGPFGKALPRQIVEVGIAEQNLVGVSAGLAATGFKVFATSPACFLAARALEQIKNDVAYSDNAVVLVGISAGVSYGALGSTHHSLHDLAALRAIHNIEIFCPADNFEADVIVRHAAGSKKPAYIRFGKAPLHDLPKKGQPMLPTKARVLVEGSGIGFIATGETVIHAVLAAQTIRERTGQQPRVLSMPCLRPLDTTSILETAARCDVILSVEEHMIHGGLGEACAAVLAQNGDHQCRLKIIGIPDEETVTGSQADIFRHYGISREGLLFAAQPYLSA